MADDESAKIEPEIVAPVPGPLPSREPRHDPGVIEGEAREIRAAEPLADEDAAAQEPPFDSSQAQDAEMQDPGMQDPEMREPEMQELPPPRRRGGWTFAAALIGALIGAVLALAAAWCLDPRAGEIKTANSRLTVLQRNMDAEGVAGGALDKRLRALEASEASAAKATTLDALGRRVAALESATAKSASAGNDAVQNALNEARAARADAAKALALAGSATAGQSAAAPAPGGAPASDVDALGTRVGKLEGDLTALKTSGDLAQVEGRLAKLETALAAPKSQARVAPSAASAGGGVGAAVLAISLVERLHAGTPYAPELAALGRFGADSAKLAALQPFAETGAPTLRALRADFAKIEPAVAAAAKPPQKAGVMDRLFAHMSELVRVHKVGEAAADDPEGLTARIAGALARGDLAAALEAYRRLPANAQQPGADWAKLVEARRAAGEAALALRAEAVGRLAAAKD